MKLERYANSNKRNAVDILEEVLEVADLTSEQIDKVLEYRSACMRLYKSEGSRQYT